jgi:hypothetical protein
MSSSNGTVVELFPRPPKVKGSSTATPVDTGTEEKVKELVLKKMDSIKAHLHVSPISH